MLDTTPLDVFWVTSLATVLFVLFVSVDPTRRASLALALRSTPRQALLTLILYVWLLAVGMAMTTSTGHSLLGEALASLGAGLPEKAASLPFAVHDIKGDFLSQIRPVFPSEEQVFFTPLKRSLIAFIASGVTAFAALILFAGYLAHRSNVPFPEGLARLKTLPGRGVLLTGILLWILTNACLFVWPTRHLAGTLASGEDCLLVFLHFLPRGVPVILWITIALGWWHLTRAKKRAQDRANSGSVTSSTS